MPVINSDFCAWQVLTTKGSLDALQKEGLNFNRQLEQRAALTKLLTEADQGQQDAQHRLSQLIQVVSAD